jgi:hypothetical protein
LEVTLIQLRVNGITTNDLDSKRFIESRARKNSRPKLYALITVIGISFLHTVAPQPNLSHIKPVSLPEAHSVLTGLISITYKCQLEISNQLYTAMMLDRSTPRQQRGQQDLTSLLQLDQGI